MERQSLVKVRKHVHDEPADPYVDDPELIAIINNARSPVHALEMWRKHPKIRDLSGKRLVPRLLQNMLNLPTQKVLLGAGIRRVEADGTIGAFIE